MHKILITTSSFGKNDPGPLEDLQRAGLEAVLNPVGRKLTEQEVRDLIVAHKPIGILAGVEPLTAELFNQARNLKAIARAGIGMDSVDLDAAEKQGISVTNTPDAPTIPVAELTLGMILSLLRRIHFSDASIRAKGWERPMGQLVFNKTIGIIGCGRIGTKVARLLEAFGCKIIGYDPACNSHDYIQIQSLDRVLRESHVVSLHLPYMTKTHHFMNQARISQMMPGAYLVNAARGGLVDEQALYHALADGHLAGAALDCFEQEPYTGPLTSLDNVLLTGHIGSYAREARIMMETQAAQNLISQLKKKGVL